MLFTLKNSFTFHLLLLSSSLFMFGMQQQDMPLLLQYDLSVANLAPQCAFLRRVNDNDRQSVSWMLKNWPIPQDKNPLDHFTLHASDFFPREHISPMAVAQVCDHIDLAKDILLPLAPLNHTVTSPSSTSTIFDEIYNSRYYQKDEQKITELVRKFITDNPKMTHLHINGPHGVFAFYPTSKYFGLYLAACTKNTVNFPLFLQKCNLQHSNPAHTGPIAFLLRIVIINNDAAGLHQIKKLICGDKEYIFNEMLGGAFSSLIGDNITEDDIKQYMNSPLLKDKKRLLLLEFNRCCISLLYKKIENLFTHPKGIMLKNLLHEAIEADWQNQPFFIQNHKFDAQAMYEAWNKK